MSTEEALLAATRNGAELTAREFRNYAALIDFFMLHLDGYAYDNLSPFERSAGSMRSTPAMRHCSASTRSQVRSGCSSATS